MMQAPNIGLRRITLSQLEPDFDNILIIAIIIGKQSPRKFLDKSKESEQYRAVWNFTLRDSQRDYINVSYWGPSEDVCASNDKFYTGDVVELRNPRIAVRKFNEVGEQFCPIVTSPFMLMLNEYSQILHYQGDTFPFTKLLNFSTKPLSGYVPLRDIQTGGAAMKERVIDILGAVRNVGPIKSIKSKTGREFELREILLFDQTCTSLRVTLWQPELISKSINWKPRKTILFITDTRVVWSEFMNAFNASVTSRSIVTENPMGKESEALANFARTAPLETVDILDKFILDFPDPQSIQNVMCVRQVINKINNVYQNSVSATPQQLTGLLFVIVTQFDLDGPTPVVRIKCASCKNVLKDSACTNMECPVFKDGALSTVDYSFEIRVNLSDHTGTINNCRLSGKLAEDVLNCSVQQFLRYTDDQKAQLKWKFLLERCAVRIVALTPNKMAPRISILSFSKASVLETVQKIPLC